MILKRDHEMKQLAVLVTTSILFVSGCSPLTKREQVLFGLMVGAHLADYETTRQCLSRGGVERNPILGEQPNRESLVLFKLGSVAVLWGLGELFPDHRETVYTLGAVAGSGVAVYNR